MAQQTELKTVVVNGFISATSNKVSDKFPQKNQTKTAYIVPNSPEDAEKLKQFGLHEYGTDEKFFIVKTPVKGISVWAQGKKLSPLDTSVDTPNFKSTDKGPVGLAITEGENMGNKFYRLTAVNVIQESDIESIEETNPFA